MTPGKPVESGVFAARRRTGFIFFIEYPRELQAVVEKENEMAGNSRSRELKKPEMTLKERRAIKREKMLENSVPKRKQLSR
jgi:hypothetical protein